MDKWINQIFSGCAFISMFDKTYEKYLKIASFDISSHIKHFNHFKISAVNNKQWDHIGKKSDVGVIQ